MECVEPTEKELRRGSVIANTVGDWAKMNIAKWNLTALGKMWVYCYVDNSKDNMARMEAELQLAASYADISAIEQANMANKNAADNGFLLSEAPAAALKLQKSDRKCEKITVREIISLLGKRLESRIQSQNRRNQLW